MCCIFIICCLCLHTCWTKPDIGTPHWTMIQLCLSLHSLVTDLLLVMSQPAIAQSSFSALQALPPSS